MSLMLNPLIIPIGLLVGIAVSAPVGPVNVLCIQRTLQRGVPAGIAAGLGAVIGDGLIALAAALGIGAITTTVIYYRAAIQLVGGAVLIAFGILLFYKKPAIASGAKDDGGFQLRDFLWDIPKAFFMTITNPGAVLGLFAIFGAIGTFVEVRGAVDALVLVAAIMVGSLAWWAGLALLIASVRDRFDLNGLARINKIAGIALVLFGLVLLGEIAWITIKTV